MEGVAMQEWQKTACILCECNCGLEVSLDGRRLAKIRGDKEHPGSQGYSCEKPLRLDHYQTGRHRLDGPMRRRPDGTYEPISWDDAFDGIAARLKDIHSRHGGEAIGFYGGGGQGNHLGGAHGRALMNALDARVYANALAQEKTGENWVDIQLYGNHTVGDFANSEVVVFVGKNPWQSHGVSRARPVLREIARDPERSMIVIDPRRSETAAMADFHLQVRPGADAWCVAALVAVLVQENLVNREWLNMNTTGAGQIIEVFQDIDIPAYAERCGVAEDLLRAAGRRIGAAKGVATYEDLGVQQAPNSTLVSYLQKMLWILTGSFAKPGGVHMHSWLFPIAGSWYPIDGRRRLARTRRRRRIGLAMMAAGAPVMRRILAVASGHAAGERLSRYAARLIMNGLFDAVAIPVAGEVAERLSNRHSPERSVVTGAPIISGLIPAATFPDEILTDHPARIRALWVDASNPVHSLPNSARWREALAGLECSVVIDVAMTETARCADYVLPAASQFEKWELSLFTMHFPDNHCQLRAPLMPPLPGTKPEPEIYAEIIDRLGVVEPRIIDELRAVARSGPEAFGLAFFSSIHARPELSGLAPYLLYRSLGTALPAGDEAVALVWAMAQLAAIAQPQAVSAAGFSGTGFALGQNLFEAIYSRRQGVTFTTEDYRDAWRYVQHDDGRFHLVIPELLDELGRLDRDLEVYTSAEFPLVLSAGERRSFTANVIIRNPAWRRRDPEGALRISPGDAGRLGLVTGDRARVITASGSAVAAVEVTDVMQDGHVSLPNGMGVSYPVSGAPKKDSPANDSPMNGTEESVGVALNELTSTTLVDKFWGTPWHKHVPARVEPFLPAQTDQRA
jgi:anaerobic selenocysteine-containing dehydrogenase